jgi:hypothetical protein
MKLFFTLIFCQFTLIVFGQSYDIVKIIAGKGIIFNNDSILISKTDISSANRILGLKNIKSSIDSGTGENYVGIEEVESIVTAYSGYDSETGEEIDGVDYMKIVRYKSLLLEFTSETNVNNLKLSYIKIGKHNTIKVFTDTGLNMKEINPNIINLYPVIEEHDNISSDELIYNYKSHGILFKLEKLDKNNKGLIEISIHTSLEE